MKYVTLEQALQPGQSYVAEAASDLGLELKAAQHEVATDTCFEKAELLGWEDAARVVKAVFFYKGEDLYGFIFPELGTEEDPRYIERKETLPKVLGVSRKQAKSFHNSYCPDGMEYGTCTPFVLEDSFEHDKDKKIKRLFVHDIPSLDSEVVDISIGGEGEEAHKTSLHLQYGSIYDILKHQFGEKVEKVNLF